MRETLGGGGQPLELPGSLSQYSTWRIEWNLSRESKKLARRKSYQGRINFGFLRAGKGMILPGYFHFSPWRAKSLPGSQLVKLSRMSTLLFRQSKTISPTWCNNESLCTLCYNKSPYLKYLKRRAREKSGRRTDRK